MFKIYSKGCEYALRALTQIPSDNIDSPFIAKELCKKAKVPEASTRKVFQKLAREGFLSAVPGPGGGYKLVKSPDKISLLGIVVAVDGQDVFDKCIMGLPNCSNKKPCPVHNTWQKLKKVMMKEMEEKTLLKLMKAVKG